MTSWGPGPRGARSAIFHHVGPTLPPQASPGMRAFEMGSRALPTTFLDLKQTTSISGKSPAEFQFLLLPEAQMAQEE